MSREQNSVFKRLLAMLLACALMTGSLLLSGAGPVRAVEAKADLDIYPVPQSVTYAATFSLGSTLTLVGEDTADAAAVKALKTALSAYGLAFRSAAAPDDSMSVIIGEKDDAPVADALTALSLSAVPEHAEGYLLYTNAQQKRLVLAGYDGAGTFYAVQSLLQILGGQSGAMVVRGCEARDWPTMPLRGTVEGFYGTPWGQDGRLSQLNYYGKIKMNCYMYAPKDDAKHRDQWRALYTASELQQMKQLVDCAAANHVRFIYALSPGLSFHFTDGFEADFQLLVNKMQSLYDIGVRDFAIFLDDIPSRDATSQAKLLNRFKNDFILQKGDVSDLITVFPEYYTDSITAAYTNKMAAALEQHIEIMWTGKGVTYPTTAAADFSKPTQLYQRNMLLWWNYPVNDYCRDNLLVGPATGLNQNLSQVLTGFISNPMEQGEASKLPLGTIADFAWNPSAYKEATSFARSAAAYDAALSDDLVTFAENSMAPDFHSGKESPTLRPLITAFQTAWNAGASIQSQASALSAAFGKLSAAAEHLRQSADSRLMKEIKRYVDKMAAYGVAGQNLADAFIAMEQSDVATFWNKLRAAQDAMDSLTDNTCVYGGQVITPFLNTYLPLLRQAMYEKLTKSTNTAVVASTSLPTYQSYTIDRMTDGDLSTFFWSSEIPGVGDYVALDLGSVKTVSSLYLLSGDSTGGDTMLNGRIEYSSDKVNWTALAADTSKQEVYLTGLSFSARYVRYVQTKAGADKWAKICEFQINPPGHPGQQSPLITNIPQLAGAAISTDAAFGCRSITLPDTALSLQNGDYIGFDLQQACWIDKIEWETDVPIASAIVETSQDGQNWEKAAGFVTPVSYLLLEEGVCARYVRVRFTAPAQLTCRRFALYSSAFLAPKASTNLACNNPQYLVDHNRDTVFSTGEAAKSGKYVEVDYGISTPIHDITIEMSIPSSPYDYIHAGKLEYSNDGKAWTQIGRYTGAFVRAEHLNITARYLRYTSTTDQIYWVHIHELSINSLAAVPATVTPEAQSGAALSMDGDLSSAYTAAAGVNTLRLAVCKPYAVSGLSIFADKLPQAQVYGITVSGERRLLGTAEKSYCLLSTSGTPDLTAIELEWTDNGSGRIYEMIPTYAATAKAVGPLPKNDSNDIDTNGSKTTIPLPTTTTRPTRPTSDPDQPVVTIHDADVSTDNLAAWYVKESDTRRYTPADKVQKPEINMSVQNGKLVLVRSADSTIGWPDAYTVLNTDVLMVEEYLYYNFDADCQWNINLSFGNDVTTTNTQYVIKLAKYILQNKGTSIDYDADGSAGHYEGRLNLYDTLLSAIEDGHVSAQCLNEDLTAHIGRLNFWHVGGTPEVSKITISSLFVGHEGNAPTTTTTTTTNTTPLYETGDVTRDGVVDMRDARLLFQYVSGMATLDAAQQKLADVTGRGAVDMKDARTLFQQVAGA